MPPDLVLTIWFVLLVGLFYFDPAKIPGTSAALWVPMTWMFIVASRLPSQWLGGSVGSAAEALEEGSPLDRAVLTVLILLAIGVLVSRSFNWAEFLARNIALTAFICFALASVVWSDFPFVCLKRWFKDFGNYLVILVVLSDPRPLEAVRTLFRRLCYLLIPLSIVLIKYFPALGKRYSEWTGANEFVGVATTKNMLGIVCLISGLFFFWDTVTRWSDRKERYTKRIIIVNFAFVAMTLWLLNLADSATSSVCLVVGCVVIVVVRSAFGKRHPGFLKALIPSAFGIYLIVAFGFGAMGSMASAVGRDPTLTGRSDIWNLLLGIHTNPLVGTGYESFWLGPRLAYIWKSGYGTINEAHNGYLEIYLSLGMIGVALVVGFLLASYRTICKRLTPSSSLASFGLAVWTIILFYNMTESAFGGGLMWLALLISAMVVPAPLEGRAPTTAAVVDAGTTDRLGRLWLQPARPRR